MSTGAKVLVVANRTDRDEICGLLAQAGYTEVIASAGGDETLAMFQDQEPDVAVICANLDAGDARSLATALRNGPHGLIVKIVLVGEERGPIRNALDAADFEVDRFVGRPLSAKALTFAVRTCADHAKAARRDVRTGDHLEEAMNRAIDEFVQGALSALTDGSSAPALMREIESGTVPNPVSAPVIEAVEPEPEAEPEIDVHVDVDVARLTAPDAAAFNDVTDSKLLAATVDKTWDEPPAPPAWREPTMIISGGGEGASPPPPPDAPQLDLDERDSGQSWAEAESVVLDPVGDDAAESGDDILADAFDDDLGDDLDEDLDDLHRDLGDDIVSDLDHPATPAPPSPPQTASDAAPSPPSGGGFARELRRKMSVMAERLFPAADGRASSIDVGVPHDHQTEIDLASLGNEVSARGDASPYGDIVAAATYADAAQPAPAPTTSSTSSAGTNGEGTSTRPRVAGPQQGAIELGRADVGTLMAKMFTGEFSGRIIFRSGDAEKSIQFEDGRPVFSTSNLPHDRMGDLLYREGKITREQHAKSRELVVESGRRMGEVLVEMGYLKRRELLPAVRRHIEDVIYSLFGWTSGTYSIVPGDFASGERIRLSRHPAAMILEGVRRKHGLDRLGSLVGEPSSVMVTRDGTEIDSIIEVADLSVVERGVVKAFDGERSIEDVASALRVDLVNVYQLAYGLMVVGVAEAKRPAIPLESQLEASRAPALVGETDLAIDRQRVLAKFSLVGESDYFALLGVRRDATRFEITRAYEAARRDYAADNFPAEVRDELSGEIDEINCLLDEAYQVLREDRLRTSYLANLRD